MRRAWSPVSPPETNNGRQTRLRLSFDGSATFRQPLIRARHNGKRRRIASRGRGVVARSAGFGSWARARRSGMDIGLLHRARGPPGVEPLTLEDLGELRIPHRNVVGDKINGAE